MIRHETFNLKFDGCVSHFIFSLLIFQFTKKKTLTKIYMYVHVYIYIYRHEHALKAVYEMPRKNVFWLGNEQVCRSQEVKI